ncbi:MAG: RNA 2',3'-cyclic phosphodiesterase [Acidothermus sp.]|nr:RNA 2',3'-cyclic phosphodiesterase [Acidothermus sp.]MCL6538576.1 RNA 2',3'-cyclic phosphodiesterase [Acidothermus sp.]
MRLFAAVSPPLAARRHLAEALERIRAADEPWRWVDPPRWHLTLAFFGEVAEDRVPSLVSRLSRAVARARPLALRLAGAGAFDRPTRARVLWVGVEVREDDPGLSLLAARCVAAGRRSGLAMPGADRPFRGHLTLARSAGEERLDAREVVTALADYRGPWWTASELSLMRSFLGPQPRYEVIRQWMFGEASSERIAAHRRPGDRRP